MLIDQQMIYSQVNRWTEPTIKESTSKRVKRKKEVQEEEQKIKSRSQEEKGGKEVGTKGGREKWKESRQATSNLKNSQLKYQ